MKKNTLLILQILILLSGCSTKYEKDGYVICLSKDFVGIAVDLHFKTIRFKKGTEYNNEVFSSITEIYIDEIVEKSEIFLFSYLGEIESNEIYSKEKHKKIEEELTTYLLDNPDFSDVKSIDVKLLFSAP